MAARATLAGMATDLRVIAQLLDKASRPINATKLRNYATNLKQRYDHDDPCDDESCPCRKAADDSWRDHGAVRH